MRYSLGNLHTFEGLERVLLYASDDHLLQSVNNEILDFIILCLSHNNFEWQKEFFLEVEIRLLINFEILHCELAKIVDREDANTHHLVATAYDKVSLQSCPYLRPHKTDS